MKQVFIWKKKKIQEKLAFKEILDPSFFFFFDLEIKIYTTHTHILFGGRGDSNLCQMGGRNFLAPLGQMPDGRVVQNQVNLHLIYVFQELLLPPMHKKGLYGDLIIIVFNLVL